MYNRYISGAWPGNDAGQSAFAPREQPPPAAEPAFRPAEDSGAQSGFSDVASEPEVPEKEKGLNALKGLFGDHIKLPDFNADTILLLVLVYFLVADESENISDTLLIIGVLLLLGF